MEGNLYTTSQNSLYWKVYKVHYINKVKNYVKLKALFFYKSNDGICYWMNPEGKPKNFKLILSTAKAWRPYSSPRYY